MARAPGTRASALRRCRGRRRSDRRPGRHRRRVRLAASPPRTSGESSGSARTRRTARTARRSSVRAAGCGCTPARAWSPCRLRRGCSVTVTDWCRPALGIARTGRPRGARPSRLGNRRVVQERPQQELDLPVPEQAQHHAPARIRASRGGSGSFADVPQEMARTPRRRTGSARRRTASTASRAAAPADCAST